MCRSRIVSAFFKCVLSGRDRSGPHSFPKHERPAMTVRLLPLFQACRLRFNKFEPMFALMFSSNSRSAFVVPVKQTTADGIFGNQAHFATLPLASLEAWTAPCLGTFQSGTRQCQFSLFCSSRFGVVALLFVDNAHRDVQWCGPIRACIRSLVFGCEGIIGS